MIDKVEGLKLTDEQITQYIAMVEEEGKARERNFGKDDATAFAMGAAVLFFATGQQDKIPAGWVFLPLMNKSPFSTRRPQNDDPDPALAEYQHIKAQQRTADYSDQCSSDLPF